MEKPNLTDVNVLRNLLSNLCALSNNIIMQGSFTGEALVQAARLMADCHALHTELNEVPPIPKEIE
jgi:conjugal transfer/entry exclusion protein